MKKKTYPLCEKWAKNHKQSVAIINFLQWIESEKQITFGMHDAKYDEGRGRFIPVHVDVESMLYEYYGIDQKKIEAERQQILEDVHN